MKCFLKLLHFLTFSLIILIGLTFKSNCYAFSINTTVNILSQNVSTLPNGNAKTCLNRFLSSSYYTDERFIFDDDNDLIIFSCSYSSNAGYEYDIHYIKLGDADYCYSYINNGYQVIGFNSSVKHHRYDFRVNGSNWIVVNETNNNITSLTLSRANTNVYTTSNVYISTKLMKNSSYTSNYTGTYYFNETFNDNPIFTPSSDWSFTYKYAKELGTLQNYNVGDDINFLLIDTRYGVDNAIVARVGDGLILTDITLYLSTLNIEPGVVYELYYYFNNAVSDTFLYSFYLNSGDSRLWFTDWHYFNY